MSKRLFPTIVIVLLLVIAVVLAMTYNLSRQTYRYHKRIAEHNENVGLNNSNNPIEFVKTKYGFGMFISVRDMEVSKRIKDTGTYGADVISALHDFVKPGDKVLHLGTHVGLNDLILGQRVGSTGKVYSFEPNPESFDIVRKNVIVNNMENIITLYNLGAGDKEGTARLCFEYGNTGGSALYARESYDKCYDVGIKSVDSVLDNSLSINVLFMDIEGSEIKAIEGANSLLARSRDAVIITEWNPTMLVKMGSDIQKFVQSSRAEGKRFFQIINDKYKNSYRELSDQDLVSKQHLDMVILPKSFVPSSEISGRFVYLNK